MRLWFILMILLTPGILIADGPDTIVPELSTEIQRIGPFQGWPGIYGQPPVSTAAAADRIWLIWPETMISLDADGRTDNQTLLTLFFSGQSNWKLENGIMGTDGIWRNFSAGTIRTFSPLTGETSQKRLRNGTPAALYPAYEGHTVCVYPDGMNIISPEGTALPTGRLPPYSAFAASDTRPLAAFMYAGQLYISPFDAEPTVLMSEDLPDAPLWSMAWAGDLLLLGYPGLICVLEPFEENKQTQIQNSRIPELYYQLNASQGQILLHTQEAVLNLTDTVLRNSGDFSAAVKQHALSAANQIPDALKHQYYSWILQYVRILRSRFPLDAYWPDSEARLTRLRAEL